MMYVQHERDLTREGTINAIKRLLAGEDPANLLNPEAQQAIIALQQECVNSGVMTSREVQAKR